MRSRRIRATLLGVAVLAGAGGAALSQDADGGLRLTFAVQSDLRTHDNLDLDPVSAGSTVRFDNPIEFRSGKRNPASKAGVVSCRNLAGRR